MTIDAPRPDRSERPAPPSKAREDPEAVDIRLRAGPLRLRTSARMTPAGLMAIGGLVSSILLSTAALVWVATSVARRHPLATALRR